MNLLEYQNKAYGYALPSAKNLNYLMFGLTGEVGELNSLFAKQHRDGHTMDWMLVKKELGDVLWFVSSLARLYGFSLEEIARMNIDKLESRQKRGVIGGSGDDR